MPAAYCTDCRKETELMVDHSAGDTFCSECGFVLVSHLIDETTSEWRTFADQSSSNSGRSRVGGPTNPLLVESGLPAVTANPSGSSVYFLCSSLGTMSDSERGLIQASIATMCDRLGLAATIKDRANEIYEVLKYQNSMRGRNQDSLLAACLYISCKQENKLRPIKEICSVANGATEEEVIRVVQGYIAGTSVLEFDETGGYRRW